ncbi:NADH kinase-like isoform X3 [Salvia splendens]|uniref:NADH kinase-like isoform X3 n=1 Tax=Salvia splendens TaxID=180675 RepID=UPI001C273125|nr:NADH kinase-like isoform X3 [Salvia splendens]
MVRKRLLLLLKPSYDLSLHTASTAAATTASSSNRDKVLEYLDNRTLSHKNTVNFCQKVLSKKSVEWETALRSEISEPIRDVDLVIAIGGDGTLLHASHLVDDSIPVLGVNSDPTQPKEVAEFIEEFDATRSTGYLCASTASNFEEVVDDILENRVQPSELSRMAVAINSKPIPTYALNDILLAHPCPATVSRFSFRIKKDGEPSPLLHSRSSGLRVSTGAGSTAAMHSAGGFTMPIFSRELQYLVREPIAAGSNLTHGFVQSNETMDISWFCREGKLYVDGSNVFHSVELGDTIEMSSRAPQLKMYLSPEIISRNK